jgi:hypothetical protein
MQACKPGSVPDSPVVVLQELKGSYHLSCPDFAVGVIQPTHPDRPEGHRSSESSRQACRDRDLFGLSTRKVYHAPDVATRAVGSYSTFSPLPHATHRIGKFVFCGTFCPLKHYTTGAFPLGSTMLYVARTFLPDQAEAQSRR